MMRGAGWLLLLVLPTGAMAADPVRKTPPWEKPREVARYLFLENCSVCHELAKPKSAKLGPSLRRFKNVPAERSPAFRQYITTKIQSGGLAMPPFKGTLTDDQVRLIVGYLLPEK